MYLEVYEVYSIERESERDRQREGPQASPRNYPVCHGNSHDTRQLEDLQNTEPQEFPLIKCEALPAILVGFFDGTALGVCCTIRSFQNLSHPYRPIKCFSDP